MKRTMRRATKVAGILVLLSILSVVLFRGRGTRISTGANSAVTAKLRSPVSHLVHDAVGGDKDFLGDPRFTVTSNRPPPYLRMPLPGMTEAKRLEYEIRWRLQKPKLENHSFPASSGPRRCSIHGLLIQCTEVTGVRFVIAKDVAAGSVEFGHTNTLNGRQWSQAFTDALETGKPEWWDFRTGKGAGRKENLNLLSRDGRTVLVIPEEMSKEFRDQGFSRFRWDSDQ